MKKYPLFDTQNVSAKTPKLLVDEIIRLGSLRRVAESRKVNIYYLSRLVVDGIEPTDRTSKGRCVRVALFLPKWKHRKEKPPLADWQKQIKKRIAEMVKETKLCVLDGFCPSSQ